MNTDDVFFGASPIKKESKPIDLDELQIKKRAVELDEEDEEKEGKITRRAKGWMKIDDLGLTITPKKLSD